MEFKPGSRLLAKITPLERERGLLIVGHRLDPLRGAEVAPWEVRIAPAAGGEDFASQSVSLSLDDASIYFTFFGKDDMLAMLIDQHRMNSAAMMAAPLADAIVRLRAFDLGALYGEAGLEAGDYLDFELADASGSRFLVRPLKASSIVPAERKAWLEAMGRAAEAAMESLGRPVAPPAFIRAIFSAAPESLLGAPAAAFSDYYNGSGKLAIREFGGRPFMWANEADIPRLLVSGPSSQGGGTEGLSQTLADLGFSLGAEEVEAFVRDALWRGEDIRKAISRCFVDVESLHLPPAELLSLRAEITECAERIASRWDPSWEDPDSARVRSALLAIYASFLAWIRRIGEMVQFPSDLDTEEFSLLSETMNGVCELILSLNAGGKADGKILAEFDQGLPDLTEMAFDLMKTVESDLSGKKPRMVSPSRQAPRARKASGSPASKGAKRKTKARPASEKLYTFEARLADIEPPIRRRLIVPGNRSLAELHALLQAAFGWTDSHLHFFKLRGASYGEPSPDDFEPLIDERKLRLDELALRVRSKMEYVYDYGDDWRHELVVVATKKAPQDAEEAPRCLEAERAAPPEDSGGTPGYEGLLEALAKPEDERDQEEAGFVAWAGGWMPEHCDLEAINKAIKRL